MINNFMLIRLHEKQVESMSKALVRCTCSEGVDNTIKLKELPPQ